MSIIKYYEKENLIINMSHLIFLYFMKLSISNSLKHKHKERENEIFILFTINIIRKMVWRPN